MQKVKVTKEHIDIHKYQGNSKLFLFSEIEGRNGQKKADKMSAKIQREYLDERINIKSLPEDDPDRYKDPDNKSMFWEEDEGETYLVSRGHTIELKWKDGKYRSRVARTSEFDPSKFKPEGNGPKTPTDKPSWGF